jgi:hypothetical protein
MLVDADIAVTPAPVGETQTLTANWDSKPRTAKTWHSAIYDREGVAEGIAKWVKTTVLPAFEQDRPNRHSIDGFTQEIDSGSST